MRVSGVTRQEIAVMRHALGLDDSGAGRPYRNHFCTGPGSDDWEVCNGLMERELMSRRSPSELTGGDYMFHVTPEGLREVEKAKPAPTPISRGRQRYLRWLNGASDVMPFGEWLKIKRPEGAQ